MKAGDLLNGQQFRINDLKDGKVFRVAVPKGNGHNFYKGGEDCSSPVVPCVLAYDGLTGETITLPPSTFVTLVF